MKLLSLIAFVLIALPAQADRLTLQKNVSTADYRTIDFCTRDVTDAEYPFINSVSFTTGDCASSACCQISLDGATSTDCDNQPVAVSGGCYEHVLSQAETNADRILVVYEDAASSRRFTSESIRIHTLNGYYDTSVDNLTQNALAQFVNDDTGETTASAGSVALISQGDVSAIASDVTAIKTQTDELVFTETGFLDVNVLRWNDVAPGNLDANGFVPSNLASVNGNDTRAATFATALDGNYLAKLNVTGTLAHSDDANTYKADISSLSTFDYTSDLVTVGTMSPPALVQFVLDDTGEVTAASGSVVELAQGSASGNVNVVAVGGIPVTDPDDLKADVSGLSTFDHTSDTVLLSSGSGSGQLLLASGAVTVSTNNDKSGYSLSAGGVSAVQAGLATPANVDSSIETALTATSRSELTAVPGASPTILQMLQLNYSMNKNRRSSSETVETLYRSNSTTPLGSWAINKPTATTINRGIMTP